MNRDSREPSSPTMTILKVIAAILLVLFAFAFGAMGVCGVYFSGTSLWARLRQPGAGIDPYGVTPIALGATVIGFAVAGLLIWSVVLLFKHRTERDE
jgi:hypothetical protein